MAFGTGSVKAVVGFSTAEARLASLGAYIRHMSGGAGEVQAPGDNGGPSGGRAGVDDSPTSPPPPQHHGTRAATKRGNKQVAF